MQPVRIFLASSNELKRERELFEIEIYRKCKAWLEKDIFLYLDIWEDLSAKMAEGGSQSAYNEFVKKADLVVLLAHTKVGKYTEEEFDTAFGQFKETQKPFVFTYFKDGVTATKNNRADINSLYDFQDKLSDLGHFYSSFTDFNHLWNQFNKELERLESNDFSKNEQEGKIEKESAGVYNSKNVVQNVEIKKLKGGFRVGDG
ncbi:MAG: hypothetical protein CMO01_09380 [Thalassobius sp.]|nr:hypothetical protein [Thalassovita sp.]|tara:strand:+ start:88 stop:693 length:606 start_codon:yes stop_codon:yes gene_type:complete